MLRAYLVTIRMADGSRGRHRGLYRDGCSAVVRALELFPQARSISARRLP